LKNSIATRVNTYFFAGWGSVKTRIKPEKLDPKSQIKNSPKVFDTRYRTQKNKIKIII